MNKNNIFSTAATSIVDVQNQGRIGIAQIQHQPYNTLSFLSVHRAHQEDLFKVKEVSESGNVNALLVHNFSEQCVLIMDGDILKGAKQNRVSNTSVLVAPGVKIIIPVSCVEQGRWDYASNDFRPSDEVAYRNIREQKSRDIYENRSYGRDQHHVDQRQVWDHVGNFLSDQGTHSGTASYSDAFESKKMDVGRMTDGLTVNEKANGLACFVNGKLCGIEIFNREDVYQDYFQRILNTIAMDAMTIMKKDPKAEAEPLTDTEANSAVGQAVADYNDHLDAVRRCKGVCLGEEHRLVTGKEIYYDLSYQQQTVHQSIITFEKDDARNRQRNPVRPTGPGDGSMVESRLRSFLETVF